MNKLTVAHLLALIAVSGAAFDVPHPNKVSGPGLLAVNLGEYTAIGDTLECRMSSNGPGVVRWEKVDSLVPNESKYMVFVGNQTVGDNSTSRPNQPVDELLSDIDNSAPTHSVLVNAIAITLIHVLSTGLFMQ